MKKALALCLLCAMGGAVYGQGTISVTPAQMAFGKVLVGSTTTPRYFAVTNTSSTTSITISSVTTQMSAGNPFAVVPFATPRTLTAGQSAYIQVTFGPTALGQVGANVTVKSNATNLPSVTVQAVGTGGNSLMTTSSIDFSDTAVGVSKTLSATLSSAGVGVSVTGISSSNPAYTVSGISFPVTVYPSTPVNFNVTFTPTANGSSAGTLTVANNANIPPAPTISLSGNGVTYSLSASPSSVNFVDVIRMTTLTTSPIVLTNTGTASVTISNVSVIGDQSFTSTLISGVTIPVGGTTSFTISFTPIVAGSVSATISVTYNATSPLTVSLRGNGIHAVTLTWFDNDNLPATIAGYNVYRWTPTAIPATCLPVDSSGGPINQATLIPQLTFLDVNVAETTYCYTVTAVSILNLESLYADPAMAVVPSGLGPNFLKTYAISKKGK